MYACVCVFACEHMDPCMCKLKEDAKYPICLPYLLEAEKDLSLNLKFAILLGRLTDTNAGFYLSARDLNSVLAFTKYFYPLSHIPSSSSPF